MAEKNNIVRETRELEALVNVYKDQPDNLVNKLWSWRKKAIQATEERVRGGVLEEVKSNARIHSSPDGYIHLEKLFSKKELWPDLKEFLKSLKQVKQ